MSTKFASRSAALRFSPDGRPKSLDESTRSIEFVAATEAPAQVWDWSRWDVVPEVLLMSGCRLPESGRCVFLDTHARHSVSAVIGSFREPRVAGAELIGRAYYSNTPDGEGPYVKTVEGHVTDVSIGYEINAFTWIEEGKTVLVEGREFTGPLRVVTDWTLRELSLCPIGADENAKVRQLQSLEPQKPIPRERQEKQALEETTMAGTKRAKRKAARANAELLRLRAENLRLWAAAAEQEAQRAASRTRDPDDDDPDDVSLTDTDPDATGAHGDSDDPDGDDERNDGLDKDEEDRADPDDKNPDSDDKDAEKSAVKRERGRIAEIRGICASFGVPQDQEDAYIRKGIGVNAVRKEVMGMLKAQRHGGPALPSGGRSSVKSPLIADAERRAAQGAYR